MVPTTEGVLLVPTRGVAPRRGDTRRLVSGSKASLLLYSVVILATLVNTRALAGSLDARQPGPFRPGAQRSKDTDTPSRATAPQGAPHQGPSASGPERATDRPQPSARPPKSGNSGDVGHDPSPSTKPSQPPPAEKQTNWFNEYIWTPVSGLILGIIVTIAGTILYDRLKRHVRIRILHTNNRRLVREIHGLYLQRIDPSERVSPTYVTDCLNHPATCLRSPRHLSSQMALRSQTPATMHLLIIAHCQGEVIGFIKAIYVTWTKMLFIAYVAAEGEQSLERRTMRKLLASLQTFLTPPSPVRWLSFEISNADTSLARAKERLFRQYAQSYGFELRRVGIEYLQPDLDCVRMTDCHEQPAILYLGGRQSPEQLDTASLRQIIESILLEIYLPTWLIDHRDRGQAEALEQYARGLVDLVLAGAPSEVSLL